MEAITRFGPQQSVCAPKKFYECGICGHLHPLDWDGDCREDANRFTADQLDETFPGWEEVEMPV